MAVRPSGEHRMSGVSAGAIRALERDRHPVGFVMAFRGMAGMADTVERELRMRARADRDGCRGYFPTWPSVDGIVSALPACIAFARWLPSIGYAGAAYRSASSGSRWCSRASIRPSTWTPTLIPRSPATLRTSPNGTSCGC